MTRQHAHHALFMRLSGLPGLQIAWGLRGGGAIQKFAARVSCKTHDQQ